MARYLIGALASVVELYNRKKSEDEKKYRKNDIIMEAMTKGLNEMKRLKKSR